MAQGENAGYTPLTIGERHGIDAAMNGFIKCELPSPGYQRRFEFHRKVDGEIVELIMSVGFGGKIPAPSTLVNAHVSPWRKGGLLIADELVVVS